MKLFVIFKMNYFIIIIINLLLFYSCSNSKSEKIIISESELGENLFFDTILSRNYKLSCASCHKPEFAFADHLTFSAGIYNQLSDRNTPSIMNQTDRNYYFWDGRSETLEEQAISPIENPKEMDLPITLLIRRLLKSKKYMQGFHTVYNKIPSKELIAQAISTYEKTLETSDSNFDKYLRKEDTTLMSESAKRGLNIFNNKAKCFDCHFGVDFTGSDQFKNIGIYNGKNLNDEGRYKITKKLSDIGKFKTPSLRNIAQTAPYMHNGIHKSLSDVIEYYNNPNKFISNSINRDTSLNKPLGLTQLEKKDLENFLLSLSDQSFTKK